MPLPKFKFAASQYQLVARARRHFASLRARDELVLAHSKHAKTSASSLQLLASSRMLFVSSHNLAERLALARRSSQEHRPSVRARKTVKGDLLACGQFAASQREHEFTTIEQSRRLNCCVCLGDMFALQHLKIWVSRQFALCGWSRRTYCVRNKDIL